MSALFAALVFLSALSLSNAVLERREASVTGAALRARLDRLRGLSGSAAAAEGPMWTKRVWSAAVDRIVSSAARYGHLGVGEETAQKLVWSGIDMDADRFGAIRLLSTGAGAVILAIATSGLFRNGAAAFPTALLGAAIGWAAPDMWLTARVRARQAQVHRELPLFLDLLGTALEGGLGFHQAVAQVGAEMPGVLAQEFSRVLVAAGAGGSLDNALIHMAERLGDRDVETAVETIVRGRQYGVRLAQDLEDTARALRRERVSKAEERAGRTGTLIVLPLAVFVLPVTLLVIGYPAFIALTSSLFRAG